MRSKQFHSLYVIGFLLLVCWLLFSNSAILKLSGIEPVKSSSLDESMKKNPLWYSLGRVEASHDLAETVLFVGWAFADTDASTDGRKVSLLLKNDAHCYELEFSNPEDPQLYSLFTRRSDVINAFPGKNLAGRELGFIGEFSTIPMLDGLYKVYIQCWENEETYGLATTNIWIEKKGNDFSITTWESKKAENIFVSHSELLQWMGEITSNDSFLSVNGWGLVEERNCAEQRVYVELTDSAGSKITWTADQDSRAGVVEAFQNSQYEMSGFQANIPLSSLKPGLCVMRLLIENNGEVWASAKRRFLLPEDGGKITTDVDKQEGAFQSDLIYALVVPNTDAPITSYIDAAAVNDGYLQIQGWGYANGWDSSNQKVYLQFEDEFGQTIQYSTLALPRTDVAQQYGVKYWATGFLAHIPLPDISNGLWKMKLLIEKNGLVAESNIYSFSREDDVIVIA